MYKTTQFSHNFKLIFGAFFACRFPEGVIIVPKMLELKNKFQFTRTSDWGKQAAKR